MDKGKKNDGAKNEKELNTAPDPTEISTNDPGIKPVDKSTKPESLKPPKKIKPPKKNTDYLEYPLQLEAPKIENGINWKEYFYNEVAPVVGRVAYVRKISNARDLVRRGWVLVAGELEGIELQEKTIAEKKKAKPAPEVKGPKKGGLFEKTRKQLEKKEAKKNGIFQRAKDKLKGGNKKS